jgi:uncharacterized spore protein YtfJ
MAFLGCGTGDPIVFKYLNSDPTGQESSMFVQHLLQAIAERLHSSASTHTIYGDPIETQGKTLIPVAKVSYGFGGGATGMNVLDTPDKPPSGKALEGGGGGGGVCMVPLGIVEVTLEQTRFLPFGGGKRMLGTLIVGLLGGILIGRRYARNAHVPSNGRCRNAQPIP